MLDHGAGQQIDTFAFLLHIAQNTGVFHLWMVSPKAASKNNIFAGRRKISGVRKSQAGPSKVAPPSEWRHHLHIPPFGSFRSSFDREKRTFVQVRPTSRQAILSISWSIYNNANSFVSLTVQKERLFPDSASGSLSSCFFLSFLSSFLVLATNTTMQGSYLRAPPLFAKLSGWHARRNSGQRRVSTKRWKEWISARLT